MALPEHKYEEVIKYWKTLNIKSKKNLRNALSSYSILFTYNSGAIENKEITYYDVREIFENGEIINFSSDLRTLYEIANQKVCFKYLIPKIVDKEKLNEELIKKIHKLLTKDTYDKRRYSVNKERPGEYKKHDYVTGVLEVGSDVEDVETEMKKLIDVLTVSIKDDEEIILTAAYLHNMFEKIYPFAAGNGRTIMNYYLLIHDLPPIIIYNEDKKYYYNVLEKFDRENDLDSTISFFKYEMEKTWERSLARADGVVSDNKPLLFYLK